MTTSAAYPRGLRDSYWMESTTAARSSPLAEDLHVDVAVVGAGIAGISAAWELARAGRRVAVLEADRIGAGVTGYSTAKVTALHPAVYGEVRKKHGAEAASLYARSQLSAVERVVEIIHMLRIRCDLERLPSITYTTHPQKKEDLRREAQAAQEAGLDVEFLEDADIGLPFGVAAAIRLGDQAQFHPRAYVLTLAESLQGLGGLVFERTRVTGLKEGSPCRLTTETGFTVVARDVVVATHFPVFDRALLFPRLSPRRELVVAARIDARHDPGAMFITEEDGKRSVRTTPLPDGQRLLMVTGESFTPGTDEPAARFARLDTWMHEHFSVAETAYSWAAQDNDSSDSVPLVGPLHPGARHTYVATGFGGWGMSGGVMAGQLIRDLVNGKKPVWTGLYDPRRLRSAVRSAPALLKQQADVAEHFVGDRLGITHVDSIADIAHGSGAVVRLGGQRCAVYRDSNGLAHAVSARCTHLGCLVAFNDAEKTWECPCHGSRFATDGSVLQGPAVRPLEKRSVPEQ